MIVNGKHRRTIWPAEDGRTVEIIDQTRLPHAFVSRRIKTLDEATEAIHAMRVRGAPLIGATAAYGVCLALRDDPSDTRLDQAYDALISTRPTAVNLRWALDEMRTALIDTAPEDRVDTAYRRAAEICDEDVAINEAIGDYGLRILRQVWEDRGHPDRLNVLTHCNAGWLATIDWGTALAPIYKAHDSGLPIHVWVDETRPRNQGAALTAWELGNHGVPHTVVVDSARGHLMQRGLVDLCIVGTDRITAGGDVANKIGTYPKALAARDNGIPFYVAAPSPSIDWTITDGLRDIPIEERDPREVSRMSGRSYSGNVVSVDILPPGSPAANPAFDITPAGYVTALITERGVCDGSSEGLRNLFPDRASEPASAG